MKVLYNFFISILMIFYTSVFAQQKIYVCTNAEKIYTIDLSTCSSQFIGYSGVLLSDIAVTPNGKLWGIGAHNSYLYNIDTLSGAASFVGVLGFSGAGLVELNDSVLMMAGGQNLYRINTNNGAGTYIGTTGYSVGGDLTWYDNALYQIISQGNYVIKIELNSNFTSIISVTPSQNPIFALSATYGAITSSFPFEINSILALASQKIYKYCPFGTFPELLCDSIIPNTEVFYGAASLRLPTQNPLPTACDTVNSNNVLINNKSFDIYPNPASSKVIISNGFEVDDIIIFDLTGKKVYHTSVNYNSKIEVDISTLNEGLYFIQIQSNNNVQTKKLLIKR